MNTEGDPAVTQDTPSNVFESFPSIRRYSRDIVITEKIDGCNVQIVFPEDGGPTLVGSRNRWITPGKSTDQFGFAQWVKDHEEELRVGLGLGRHYGEWWGPASSASTA